MVDMTWRCAGCCSGALTDWTSCRYHYIQRSIKWISARDKRIRPLLWMQMMFCLNTVFSACINIKASPLIYFKPPPIFDSEKRVRHFEHRADDCCCRQRGTMAESHLGGRRTTGCISEAIWHEEMRSNKITAAIESQAAISCSYLTHLGSERSNFVPLQRQRLIETPTW